MTYPGGKNGCGVYQRIINLMPPHKTYAELFLGSGAVLRNKRPAEMNIGIDLSQKALDLCRDLGLRPFSHSLQLGCGIEYLRNHNFWNSSTLIYCDPPYVADSRKGGDLYEFEMTDSDHRKLLCLLKYTDAMVMISGYRNSLYDKLLKDFYRVDYRTQTRRGMVDESLWMNFTPPNELHDYSFLGDDYRARERIKRKQSRWKNKIENMDRLERLAIMEVLQNVPASDIAVNDD